MLILTQRQKFICRYCVGQLKRGSTLTKPLPLNTRILAVVITNAQMFGEVALRVLQIRLSLRRKHITRLIRHDISVPPAAEPVTAFGMR